MRRKLRIWSHLRKKSLIEKLIFCVVRVTVQYSYNWKIGQMELLKRKTLFLGIFQNFQNRSFSKHTLKKYDPIFFRTLQILGSSPVTFIKSFHYRPFPSKFPTISEDSEEKFFLEYVFAEVANPWLVACNVIEKQTISQMFAIFEILEDLFFSEHFRKSVSSFQFVSGLETIVVQFCWKGTPLDTFLDTFQSFRYSYFKTPLW